MSNQQPEIKFIRAGAGAGKTTTLISTCIDFAKKFKEQHARYPKIIITTFTKKATQEIKERLIVEALETKSEELFQYFNKKSFVQIGTIHNILSLFLRQHSEAIGLPSDLAIVNDYKIFIALKRHLKSAFEKRSEFHVLLEHFKFDQMVQLLLKAVALKQEHSHLQNVSLNILKQQAQSERHKVISITDEFLSASGSYSEKWQLHIDFLKQVKQAIKEQNYEMLLSAYEAKPRKFTLNKSNPEISTELNEEIGKIYSEICMSPMCFDQNLEIVNQVQQCFHLLVLESEKFMNSHRLSSGEMSIADLELLSAKIMSESPQAMQNFASQFDFIMVDEYQDTSPLQVKILNALMAGKAQFIVGDPQQSIYLFRGARSEVFTTKEKEINAAGFPTVERMQNFRSHARLMTFMNDFFKGYSKFFKPMQTKNDDFSPRSFPEATFVSTVDHEFGAIVTSAMKLYAQGIAFSDITVLFKKNSDILEFAKYANQFNLPVQVQISKGFEDKAEVGDLLSLLKFLINPFDNHNLIRLLRSPWFGISDQEIVSLRQDDSVYSLWLQIKKSNHSVYELLQSIESCYLEKGVTEAVYYFINNTIFLKSAHFFDPTSLREANIWKFMQTLMANESRSDFNLSDFINHELTQFNSDLSSSDGEGIPLFAANRVSLMTVHGSKGLQFKHVIICGFNLAVRNSGTDIFTFDEESAQYSLKVVLAQFDKSFATAWADQIQEKYLQRAREENDRVLYVAMTRAIDSLTLIRTQSKTVPKHSWLEKVNWIPESFTSDKYSVAFVDINEEPKPLQIKANQQITEHKPLVIEKDYKQSSGVTSLLSDKLAYEGEKPAETNLQQTVFNYNKTQKGTDLHKCFEALKYNSLSEIHDQLSEADRKALKWLVEQDKIDLRKLFDHGHVEWGFGLQLTKDGKSQMVQGQMDAWGIIDESLYILDYKTGSAKYLSKAFDQLQAYAGCLKHMGLVKKNQLIRLAVIFPLDERVELKEISESEVRLEFSS